jgi:hypothetical protein
MGCRDGSCNGFDHPNDHCGPQFGCAERVTDVTILNFRFCINAVDQFFAAGPTPDGENIVEHIAGVEDYQVALATYRAAVERWPGTPITLRQGARVIEDSRRLRLAWSDKGRQDGL